MIDYYNVPCPKCGVFLDVKIESMTPYTLQWSKGQVVMVNFKSQTVRHTCKEKP